MTIVADRVKETTTTTGTGTVNLGGAATGFQTFVAGVGSGFQCYYCIVGGSQWEVGIGTVTSGSPDTLSRTTVLDSSNSGALVSLSSGSKDVFVTMPAGAIGLAMLAPGASQLYTPQTLTGFSDSDPVGTWADQSGNGYNLGAVSTTRPLYHVEDGIPYLSFDGSDDALTVASMTSYTGTPISVFLVARLKYASGVYYLSMSAPGSAGNAASALSIGCDGFEDHGPRHIRNSLSYANMKASTASTSPPSGITDFPRHFTVFAIRYKLIMGRAMVQWRVGPYDYNYDLGTSLTAFSISALSIGSYLSSASPNVPSNWGACDVRALAVYKSDLGDRAFAQTIEYLRQRYGAH